MTASEDPRPNIVVLDAYTLNPGDLSFDELEALGNCAIFPRTEKGDIALRARSAEIVLTNKTVLGADEFAAWPKLKFVSVLATGTNVVDLKAAEQRNVVVSNVPAYSTSSVAQATFALLFELVCRVGLYDRSVHAGGWSRQADFSYLLHPLAELAGQRFGVVGYGSVGQAVARIARAFDMDVVVATRTRRATDTHYVSIDTLFATSDIVSLHCPLTRETTNLVNEERLRKMKPSAVLINTSRGGLVDEVALARALSAKTLAGAALDVLSVEPPPADHPLLAAPSCVLTPHIAWATRASRSRLLRATVENVKAFLSGHPINVVRP